LSLALTPGEQAHQAILAKWRKAMDLVGPGPLDPHFEDAAHAVSWLNVTGRWADLGSGAGFPGVALAARHPASQVLLVESRQRRVAFLNQVVMTSKLSNLKVFHGRTETLEDGGWDGVVSRAYKPPRDYLADALRLLKPGGVALLMAAREAPPQVSGLQLFHVEHYALGDRPRQAVGYRKDLS
jgi:16S rRNA (guanine527-N7)-methyltransferase